MRCDQYIGLNEWARARVSSTIAVREVGVQVFPDGKVEAFDRLVQLPLAKRESVGRIEGAWVDHVADLVRYTFPSGEVLEEYVQADPWSSGPCYFIALKDGESRVVPESLWTDEEVAAA